MILSVWGNNHGSLEGLEMKNEGEKLEVFWERAGLPERHKSSSELWPLPRRASKIATKISLNFEGWRPALFRTPGTSVLLILPPSFRTNS